MVSQRFVVMVVASAFLLAANAQPALAGRPAPHPPPPPTGVPGPVPDADGKERLRTPQERADAAAKEQAAEAYVASAAAADPGLASLACVPNSPSVTDAATMPMHCQSSVPQDYLPVEARDQINGWYCGPAVGQVIANYSWAMGPGANKYTQGDIAAWMSTGMAGTGASWLEQGLERATAGSPLRPSDWNWIVSYLWDSDGDGWAGDQLYAYVRANISGSRMPLAFAVKPHAANAPNGAHLASWPNIVDSPGHWVAIYGWYRFHDGSDQSRLYYTDSSKDEGGGTGKYWTSTWWFTILVLNHTRYIVW